MPRLDRGRVGRAAIGVVRVIVPTLLVAACAGSSPSAPLSAPPSAAGSARPSISASGSTAPASPVASDADAVTFEISGTIGGRPVSGRLAHGALSVPCAGAGADQVLSVHWTGDADSVGLAGEIDFKPGTWTMGSAAAQGIATLGLQGGKPADSLAAVSGTVTTGSGGGLIDATFAGGSDTAHLSGAWVCPG